MLSHRRFHFAALFSALLAILTLSYGVLQGAEEPVVPHDIQKFGRLETVSHDGDHARLRFSIDPFERRSIPARVSFHFWLTAAGRNVPMMEMAEATWWAVSDDGTRHGPFGMDEDGGWGALPETLRRVRVSHVGSLRGFGMNRADFNPIHQGTRMVDSRRETFTAFVTRAEFDLRIGGTESPTLPDNPLEMHDPYGLGILNILAANASQAQRAYRRPAPIERKDQLEAWNEILGAAAERGEVWHSRLPRPGVYQIDSETLSRFGIDPANFPVERLRFFVGDREIPVLIDNLRGGLLIGEARIFFHAHKDPDERKPYIPFWIVGAGEGETPLRATRATAVSRVAESAPVVGATRLDLFEPNVYHHALPLHGPNLKWASAMVNPRAFHEMEFDLGAPFLQGETEVRFWISNREPRAVTRFAFFVNGTEVHTGTSRGVRIQEETFRVSNDFFRQGVNTIALHNLEVESPNDQSPIFFLATRLRPSINSLGLLPHHSLATQLERDTVNGVVFADYGGGTRGSLLLDITDPFRPVFTDLVATRREGRPVLTATISPRRDNPVYIFSQGDTMRRLNELRPFAAPRSFLDRDPVDYLVVYHDSLVEAIQPLLQHRRQDRAVAAYAISDVYAAFSHGALAYESIHNLIKHTFEQRTGSRVREVLLVGEGSEYWWEMTHGRPDVTENMIPIFGWADPSMRIRGDDGYSLAIGDDPLSDVEVGRISVNTPQELAKVVEKIIEFETAPPAGPWHSRHIFVTDEQPEFDRVVGEIIDKTLEGPNVPTILSLNQFPYEDYFRGIWRKRSSVMTDRLLTEWNAGARTITYMGHGGPNLWSSNRIMHLRDVDHIDVRGRFPMMVAGSCDTGWVDYPVDPVRASLAEEFLRSRDGGVIAAFIPIDGTSSYEHNFLLTAFYDALFRERIQDVGTLTLLSKVNYHLQRNNAAVTNQFLLMGDPATRLAPDPESMPLTTEPAFLMTETGGEVTVVGTAQGIEWGQVEARLLDQRGRTIATSRDRVTAGAFRTTLEVPSTLSRGLYRVIAFAHGAGENPRQYSAHLSLPVVDATINMRWDSAMREDQLQPAGTQVEVTLVIENVSDLDVNGAVLQVRALEADAELTRRAVTVAAGENYTQSFRPRLPPGLYTLQARLYTSVADLEAGGAPLAEGFIRLRGSSTEVPLVALSEADVHINRVTTADNSMVSLRLYNMTRRAIADHKVVLRRVIENEAVAVTSMTDLQNIQQEGFLQLTLRTLAPLEAGETVFALDLLREVRKDDESEEESPAEVVMERVQRLVFNHNVGLGPDLEIVPGSLALEDEHPVAGLTTFARFRVRNVGDVAIERVRGRLFLGAPWIAANEAPNSVPWAARNEVALLAPGEEHEFRLRWDLAQATPSEVQLVAAVDSVNDVVDINPVNNTVSRQILTRRAPNLALVPSDSSISHQLLRPRDSVTVNVPFANVSDLDFVREFRVTAHAITSTGRRTRLFSQRIDSLLAGETGSLQFQWLVEPGQNALEIDLNEDREYLEAEYSDNVLRYTLPHVIRPDWFLNGDQAWEFAELTELGTLSALMQLPDGHLTPVRQPRSSQIVANFTESSLLSGDLGVRIQADNRWGIDNGDLFLAFEESAEPVVFRFPLNQNYHTNLYDLYISHVGNRAEERKSGHFRYRLAGQRDYTLHIPETHGEEYLGRFRMRDQHLEIELAAPPYPSFNHIFNLVARPVEGVYTSPVVMADAFPRGPLSATKRTPEGTSVRFQVRRGTGSTARVEWRDWVYIRPGESLPADFVGEGFFQWRAFLVSSDSAIPSLRDVTFQVAPATVQVAGSR